MRYQIVAYLSDTYHSLELRKLLIEKGCLIILREAYTQRILPQDEILISQDCKFDNKIIHLGRNNRYECYYNSNNLEEADEIWGWLGREPSVLSRKRSDAKDEMYRI